MTATAERKVKNNLSTERKPFKLHTQRKESCKVINYTINGHQAGAAARHVAGVARSGGADELLAASEGPATGKSSSGGGRRQNERVGKTRESRAEIFKLLLLLQRCWVNLFCDFCCVVAAGT